MGIKDLCIVPDAGKKNIVYGYLGVTPTISLSGRVLLHLDSKVKIKYVILCFEGVMRTKLAIDGKTFQQEKKFIKTETVLMDPVYMNNRANGQDIHLLNNNNIINNDTNTSSQGRTSVDQFYPGPSYNYATSPYQRTSFITTPDILEQQGLTHQQQQQQSFMVTPPSSIRKMASSSSQRSGKDGLMIKTSLTDNNSQDNKNGTQSYNQSNHVQEDYIELEKGLHKISFSMLIDSHITSTFIGSYHGRQEFEKDEAHIDYILRAEVATQPSGLKSVFGLKSTKQYSTEVLLDVPSLDVEAIQTCELGRLEPFFFHRKSEKIDFQACLENTSLCVGKPVKIRLLRCILDTIPGDYLRKVEVFIRQEETIRSDGQQKTFRDKIGYLKSEKFKLKSIKVHGQHVWKGESWVTIPALTQRQGGLFSKKSIQVHGSFESELISVRHYIEMNIITKHTTFKIEEAVYVNEADSEIRKWVLSFFMMK